MSNNNALWAGLGLILAWKVGLFGNLFAAASGGDGGGGGGAAPEESAAIAAPAATGGGGGATAGTNISYGAAAPTSGFNSFAQQRYPALASINPNALSPVTVNLANKGALHESTYQSIVGYAAVKSGQLSAYDYGGGAAAFPQGRAAIESVSNAYQNSPTTQLYRQVAQMNREAGSGGQKYMVTQVGGHLEIVPRDY